MNNKDFDDIIKQKLDALNGGYTDDEWELFREKWEERGTTSKEITDDLSDDVDEKTNNQFDAKVKQNLRGLRMPFNSAHWVKLKAQLESEALFKKRLFVAKTVEILMLVFIVFGVLNLLPVQNEIYQLPVYDVPMVMSVPVDKPTAEKYRLQTANQSKKQIHTITTLLNKVSEISAPLFKQENNVEVVKPVIITKTTLVEPLNQTKLSDLFPFLNEEIKNRQVETSTSCNDITSISSQSISSLLLPIRPIGYPDISLSPVKNKSEEKSYISLAVGPKLNLINSPFDPVYEIDAYNTLNTNFNISVKIHKEIGPVEVYAGLGYSKTSYTPLIIEEIYKNQNEQINQASLENISFNTVNVPVGVSYSVIKTPNLHFYAAAGVDLNLIAQTDYEVYDIPAAKGSRNPDSEKPRIGKTEINQRTLLSQKEFTKGILEGGGLKDNLYASASVSLGLIKKVSNSTSLFIEPKYSQFISSQGLGPNLDKLHSISLDVGVRYQLN